MTKTEQIATLLNEFGSAIRGERIDGRAIRDTMGDFAGWVRDHEAMPDIEKCRDQIGVCPRGGGHWTDYCDEDCASA